jgi:hypothetical protein
VSDQTPSGNRWEPAGPVALGDPEPPPPSDRSIGWSSDPLFLGSAVGGYALGHDRSGYAPAPGVSTDQGSTEGGRGHDIVLRQPAGEDA